MSLLAKPKIHVDWKAHLEALPLATWIIRVRAGPESSSGSECGAVFANQACRDLLGLTSTSKELEEPWLRSLDPEERQAYLKAWRDFLSGETSRFVQKVRWIRPDTQQTVSLAVRAQKLHCGDIQGWLRTASMEDAISRLEELAYA